ncbi:MAG: orotidine 5'-phosphate decarboxylase / HUMPS family protein [archaeon]
MAYNIISKLIEDSMKLNTNNYSSSITNFDENLKLDNRKRYLQIAFNKDISEVLSILPKIPKDKRILIEAGTPYIKKEGINGVNIIKSMWDGYVVCDFKTIDGGREEVSLAAGAGANAITVLGSAPIETLNFFIEECEKYNIDSMIDMLGVNEPHKILIKLKKPPKIVILHKGRDEETTKGKTIAYKNVTKIRSKFNCIISAAGGVNLREARSAIFNGANIVVVNITSKNRYYDGIDIESQDISQIANEFLKTIE